eukprot:CAMPEP_0202862428 /NCGR_PEP_ID=MMETSP1391-20130828/3471_1 /ASSEMBLY_ACC=CAM_ASM_000867 /TAXON_ID=1034604 /ORGANISM="Chlamydomonas leiostraca, Strain SAG 11-49" /LENGTH=221 /DNA_ID=CAMNT_0049541965 /DNA_START=364 /DNA_END=1026 /DNA_ORIENTATION=+
MRSLPQRVSDSQLFVVYSEEPAPYYPQLDDPVYMRPFDVEMTYRRCSQVPLVSIYIPNNTSTLLHVDELFHPPVPFVEKKPGIVYINSNCATLSNRAQLMKQLMGIRGFLPVHSFGQCDNNMPGSKPGRNFREKIKIMRGYLFCVAMENSIAQDYVSEKLYDALAAGCIPLYLGAPNVNDFIPAGNAIIDASRYVNNVTGLAAELLSLYQNRDRYNEMLAW